MKKISTILLVDILSILSLPFLITGMLLHLLSTVISGCLVLPLLIAGIIIWSLVHTMLLDSSLMMVIIAVFIMGLLLFLIIALLFELASAIYIALAALLSNVISGIAIWMESTYLKILNYTNELLAGCDEVEGNERNNILVMVACFPFFLNWFCYFLVNQLLRFCRLLAVLASAGVLGVVWIELSTNASRYLGTGLISSISLFPAGDIILAAIDLLLLLIVLLSAIWYLGTNWAALHDAFEEAGVGEEFEECYQTIKNMD